MMNLNGTIHEEPLLNWLAVIRMSTGADLKAFRYERLLDNIHDKLRRIYFEAVEGMPEIGTVREIWDRNGPLTNSGLAALKGSDRLEELLDFHPLILLPLYINAMDDVLELEEIPVKNLSPFNNKTL